LVIVTYGGHGGTKCAAQLRRVADGLHMRTVSTMPAIELTDEMIKSASVNPDMDFAVHVEAVRQAFAELAAQLQSPDNHRQERRMAEEASGSGN
jgi:NAD(P)H-dependent FMN reductase